MELERFEGLFPAAITPMDEEGDLDEAALEKVLEFNLQAGVQGFWLAGGTGESVLLDDEENMRVASLAVARTAGRAATIMHVGTPTTRRSVRLAEHAARAGADAICCVPPFYYSRSEDEIVEHYRAVGAAAGLPLFLYNLPGMTGVEITLDLIRRIRDGVPQLAGLKHSSSNQPVVHDFAQMGLRCFIGNSMSMLPAMSLGAVGCVDGPPLMEPAPWLEIRDAYRKGDLARAEAAQRRAREMVQGIFALGGERYIASIKAVMSHRLGVECGDPRPPARPLTDEERRRVVETADALGLGRVPLQANGGGSQD